MRWINPEMKNFNPALVKKFHIRPGSMLDVPKLIVINPRDFEDKLDEHFRKQILDVELLRTLSIIYRAYKETGAVDIQSSQGRVLGNRHERFIVELIKSNIEHIEQVSGYYKAA